MMVNKKVTQVAPQSTVPQRKVIPPTAKRAEGTTAGGANAKDSTQRAVAPRQNAATMRLEGLRKAFRESVAELRKVQWPDRMTTRNLTLVVIGMSASLAVLLGTLDAILTRLIEWLVSL